MSYKITPSRLAAMGYLYRTPGTTRLDAENAVRENGVISLSCFQSCLTDLRRHGFADTVHGHWSLTIEGKRRYEAEMWAKAAAQDAPPAPKPVRVYPWGRRQVLIPVVKASMDAPSYVKISVSGAGGERAA